MATTKENGPVRSFMDDEQIKWRNKHRPDFSKVDKTYLEGRTRNHPVGSLQKLLENALKTFEMEATHKVDQKDWGSVDPEKFRLFCNGSRAYKLDEVIERGTYNCFLENQLLYDSTEETFDSSMDKFKTCFPNGFAWEVLDVQSGPPTVSFTWRHWGRHDGEYNGHPASGENIEMYGSTVATLDDQLRIVDCHMFFDPTPFLAKLNHVKCPFMK